MELKSNGKSEISYTRGGQTSRLEGNYEFLNANTLVIFSAPGKDTLRATILLLDDNHFNHIYDSHGSEIERRFVRD